MSNTPRRHGLDWSRQPVPATSIIGKAEAAQKASSSAASAAAKGASAASSTVTPIGASTAVQIVPVAVVHAFYQNLPRYGVQHLSSVHETAYTPARAAAGTVQSFTFWTVPTSVVYVLTDLFPYVLAPGKGLNAPLVKLDEYQVTGMLRFQVLIGRQTSMQLECATVPPGGGTNGLQTGWPLLETEFGVRRGGGFALYARSQQAITVTVQADAVPRFPFLKAGFHVHGFTVPEGTFDKVFKGNV